MLIAMGAADAGADENKFHALIIGNSKYTAGALDNPVNDATLMETTLTGLGFKVTKKLDLGQQEMEESIREFGRSVPEGSFALFYYAGHGIQVGNNNYIIPVDAKLDSASALRYKTVHQNYIIDELSESKAKLKAMVFDCCRDNPFSRSWKRSTASTRFASLNADNIPEGVVIGYATSEGMTASDGGNGETNSPYTSAFAKAISATPSTGLRLRDVFLTASREVFNKTNQQPDVFDPPYRPEYFLVKPGQVSTAATKDPTATATSSPATPVAKPSSTPAIPTSEVALPKTHPLLEQAEIFVKDGNNAAAMEAFSSVINSEPAQSWSHKKARKARGRIHAKKGKLDLAIIDYLAAGEKGMPSKIYVASADVLSADKVVGTVAKGEVVYINQAHGEWLRISKKEGSGSWGFVAKKSFLKAKSSAPAAPSPRISSAPAVSSAPTLPAFDAKLGSSANVIASQPGNVVKPQGGNIVQPGASSNTIVSSGSVYDASGRLVSPSPAAGVLGNGAIQSSGQVFNQYGQPVQGAMMNGANLVQRQPQQQQLPRQQYVQPQQQYAQQQFSQQQYQQPQLQQQPRYQQQQPQYQQQPMNRQQYAQPQQQQQGYVPPRPKNAWETPQFEGLGRAREMKASQEAWDRRYGGR